MKLPYNRIELAYIKYSYRDMSNKELGAIINRSPASIRKKRHAMSCNRTPAELKRIFQRNNNLYKKGADTRPLIKSDRGMTFMF